MLTTIDYLSICLIIGLGISIDCAIGTIARFRNSDLSFKNWTLPIATVHIFLLIIGYYVFWEIAEGTHILKTFIGFLGFALVSLLIYEMFCESIGKKAIFNISENLSGLLGIEANNSKKLITIIAVSLDALLCGPAMAIQAEISTWTNIMVISSILIAGLIVALATQFVLFCSRKMRERNFSNIFLLAKINFYGKYLEFSIIGGFGIFPLWYIITNNDNLFVGILISSLLMLILFTMFNKELKQNEVMEYKEILQKK